DKKQQQAEMFTHIRVYSCNPRLMFTDSSTPEFGPESMGHPPLPVVSRASPDRLRSVVATDSECFRSRVPQRCIERFEFEWAAKSACVALPQRNQRDR